MYGEKRVEMVDIVQCTRISDFERKLVISLVWAMGIIDYYGL